LDRAQAAVDAAERKAKHWEIAYYEASEDLRKCDQEATAGRAAGRTGGSAHSRTDALAHLLGPDVRHPSRSERDEAREDARYWESVIDDIARIVKPPQSAQSKGGAVTDAVERTVRELAELHAALDLLAPDFPHTADGLREAYGSYMQVLSESRAQLAAAQQENARLRAAALQFWGASALVREDNGASIEAYNDAVDALSRELNGGARC
jgi:hypothetical protein